MGIVYCTRKLVSEEYNFQKLYPILSLEWHYKKNHMKPNEIHPKSSKKVWWICDKKHEWEDIVKNRSNGRCKELFTKTAF